MKKQALQHCPVCGKRSPLKKDGKSLFLECSSNHRFYINPNPTVSAIIYDDNKILLTKRAIEPSVGKWDLVNGYMELDEVPIEAIKREVKEEIGVNFISEDIFAFNTSNYYLNDLQKNLNIYFYGYIDLTDKIKIDRKEILQVKWFDFDKMPFDKMSFEHHIPVIKDFIKIQKGCKDCIYHDLCGS